MLGFATVKACTRHPQHTRALQPSIKEGCELGAAVLGHESLELTGEAMKNDATRPEEVGMHKIWCQDQVRECRGRPTYSHIYPRLSTPVPGVNSLASAWLCSKETWVEVLRSRT